MENVSFPKAPVELYQSFIYSSTEALHRALYRAPLKFYTELY